MISSLREPALPHVHGLLRRCYKLIAWILNGGKVSRGNSTRPRLSDSTDMSGRSRHGKWHPESFVLGAGYAHAQGAVLGQGEYRFSGSKAWRTFTAVCIPAAPSARVACPRAEAPQGGTVAHIDSCIVMLRQSICVGGGLSACLVRCDGLFFLKYSGHGNFSLFQMASRGFCLSKCGFAGVS